MLLASFTGTHIYKTSSLVCPLNEREMGRVGRDGFAEHDNWTEEEGEEECAGWVRPV